MTTIFTLVILVSGLLLSYVILKNVSLLERLAISIGLGILIYSLFPFVQVLYGIPLSKESVLILILFSLLILIFLNLKNWSVIIKDLKSIDLLSFRKHSVLLMIAFGLILMSIAMYFPISGWDALTLYDFRGKVLSQGLHFKDIQYLDSFDKHNPGYYFSYPPSTSFIHADYYVLGSKSPQVIYPLIFIGLIIFFYSSISHYISKENAFLFSAVLMVSNVLSSNAVVPYTNLPYAYFYFISTVLLVRYLFDRKNIGIIIMSAIFLAGSLWMRSVEPFYIVNILVIIYFLIKKQVSLVSTLFFVLPVLVLKEVWGYTQKAYATNVFLSNVNVGLVTKGLLSLSANAIKEPISAYFGFISQNILLFVILIITLATYFVKKSKKSLNPEILFLIIIFSDLAVIFAGTFAVGILLPGRSEIYASIARFGIFLFPLILFISGLMLKDLFKE